MLCDLQRCQSPPPIEIFDLIKDYRSPLGFGFTGVEDWQIEMGSIAQELSFPVNSL